MSRKIINTNIRLNLENEADRKAWEYLQGMDRKIYKSYTKAVVAALNDYFERQERLAADPYLETRQKEDEFLQKILNTIEQGLKSAGAIGGLMQFLGAGRDPIQEQNTEEDNNAALEFADSF